MDEFSLHEFDKKMEKMKIEKKTNHRNYFPKKLRLRFMLLTKKERKKEKEKLPHLLYI